MSEVTVARYLVSRIEDLGIDFVPLIQGGAINKMIDEVGQSKRLQFICPNHEQALAMMVDAYARLRGFGVGLATSGPGGTNLATGIGCAYYDSIPCLFITGQVGRFHIKGNKAVRQRGFQETDIVSLSKPITKYSVLLDHPEEVRYVFEKAVYLAKSGRPGPVLIDLPHDVQRTRIDPSKLRGFTPPENSSSKKDLGSQISNVISDLKKAKRPVILAGGGVRLGEQEKALITLVEILQVPVVSTWAAADIFEHRYPLYAGNAGKCGNRSAVEVIQQSDFLLALGTRFTTRIVINEKKFAENAKIVSVDIDKGELKDGLISADVAIPCDLKVFIPEILRQVQRNSPIMLNIAAWRHEVDRLKKELYKIDATRKNNHRYVSPYEFMDVLSDELSPDAVIIPDCGANLTWTLQGYKAKRGQRLLSAWGNSPMGYSLPASIGAYYANKKSPVITLIGDGGLQLNIHELQTAVINKVPLKLFVLNNECYGIIKHGGRAEFGKRVYGSEPRSGYRAPDFVNIARAYGIQAFSLKSNKNLRKRIKAVLKSPGPLLVDVKIDPEQYFFETTSL